MAVAEGPAFDKLGVSLSAETLAALAAGGCVRSLSSFLSRARGAAGG